jgi:hypothetical protein
VAEQPLGQAGEVGVRSDGRSLTDRLVGEVVQPGRAGAVAGEVDGD